MYAVATRLGKTVEEIGEMPSNEMTDWFALMDLEAHEREQAQQRRKNRG